MFLTDIKLFSSEISLIFGALFILLYGIFFNKSENFNKGILYITFISLITSFYLAIFFFEDNTFLFNNLLINNSFILFFKCLIFFGTIV